MRSRILALGVIGAVTLGVASCKKSSTPTTPTNPGGGGNTNAAAVSIPVGDGYSASSFTPESLNIARGVTVTWTNRDSTTHNVSSNSNLFVGDMTPGGTFSRRFDTAGSFTYRCTLHPTMTGTVNVQ
jgi:plastocyanin